MQWTVGQLQKFQNSTFEIDQTVDVTHSLRQRDPQIIDASLIRVKSKVEVDSQKASFHLHLTGTLILPCSRTLVDTEYPIDIHSTEIYMLNPNNYSFDDEEEVHEPVGGVVNLIPVVEELLILEVPMQVFSKEALNNVKAGKDWEVMTEDEFKRVKENQIDPRLAGLADLFKDKNE